MKCRICETVSNEEYCPNCGYRLIRPGEGSPPAAEAAAPQRDAAPKAPRFVPEALKAAAYPAAAYPRPRRPKRPPGRRPLGLRFLGALLALVITLAVIAGVAAFLYTRMAEDLNDESPSLSQIFSQIGREVSGFLEDLGE